MEEVRKLVYNAIQTPDGTVIESTHRHDYVTHEDANGKHYMIDGGLDYVRRSANGDEVSLQVFADEPHEKVRRFAFRTGYGKPGAKDYGTYRLTRIMDMTNQHVDASIALLEQAGRTGWHLAMLKTEQSYRKDRGIVIND